MIHVLERRDNTIVDALGNPGWAINPTGPLQQAQDVQVAERGQFLLNYELAQFNLDRTTGQPCIPTIVNEYCGWFPETTTFEHVVGPAANPDYDLPTSRYGNPWYVKPDQNPNLATENPMRLLYKQAADLLKTMAVISVIPNRPNAAFLWSYRRRSSDDPIRTSRTDDTEFIILKPQIMSDLSVWTTMSWDDTKLALIAKMV
ncbi:hypothetical protein GQ43DRAFT_62735 [Delitschia confertaspora ATCC 74209]|uniref:Uncharacterized protein n=1 Tax=Delitschia confertaspora ATCC 74209 TaxID=1513339 RepID=A0A9P4JM45_9PLEO|nr:hypothetical protein GQ43DRAFT_62735 [Delitschia confertaspora ATCC 74209]